MGKRIFFKITVCFIWGICLFISLWRVRYGIELSDEAIYLASGVMYSKGALPFVDIWSHIATSVFTYGIWVKMWMCLSGGTEGIFFALRIMYILWKFIVIYIIYRMLLPYINSLNATISLMGVFLFTPFNVFQFSYNTIPYLLIFFVGILLSKKNERENRMIGIYCAISGILMAICVLASTSVVFVCAAIAIILLFEDKKAFGQYVLGGLCVAVIIVLRLIIQGGMGELCQGIYNTITAGCYLQIERVSWESNAHILMVYATSLFKFILLSLIVQCIVLFVYKVTRLSHSGEVVRKTEWFTIALYTLIVLFNYFLYANLADFLTMIVPATWFLPLFLLIVQRDDFVKKILIYIYIPYIVYYIGVSMTSWTGTSSREYILFPLLIVNYILLQYSIPCLFKKRKYVTSCIVGLCAIMTIISIVIFNFSVVYRDEKISQLNTRIEAGIYKGLYTTEENAEEIINLERYIKEITREQDEVLFLDQVPFAYLMSNGKFCTPTTMDPMLYSYHVNDDTLLLEFYKVKEKKPDKIIYIWTGRDKILSVEDENIPFNEYIESNYILKDEVEIGKYRVKYYLKAR